MSMKIDFDRKVTVYEIEENDSFSYEDLTPEESSALDNKNSEYIDKTLQDRLLKTILQTPCQCRLGAIMEREMRRAKIMQPNGGQVGIRFEQEDIDYYKFGVVMLTKNGVYRDVDSIVRQCTNCKHTEFWVDPDLMTQMMAEVSANMINANVEEEDEYVEEDIVDATVPSETISEVIGNDVSYENIDGTVSPIMVDDDNITPDDEILS